MTAGPGTYNTDRADNLTKTKSPNINLGSSPSRPQSFAKPNDVDIAPGQYDDRSYEFGRSTKGFIIGEKRETRIEMTAGPGTYNADRADSLTKTKSPNINLGSSPSRPHSFGRGGDVDVAPGQYEDRSYKFGNDTKGFTIGEKRETRIERTVGPGEYDMERADNMTKSKSPQVALGNSPSRPGRVGETAVAGQYGQTTVTISE